jgi:CheY-like chemotaxis protein
VLVVDDNVDAADMLARALSAVGYEVAVAHDGPTALDRAREFSPDAALLDIGLPVMDGYELAQRLREMNEGPRALALIAVTGYGQLGDRARSAAAGFGHHLVKPVDIRHLAAVLDTTLAP